ncbi:hypothetical protein LTR02_002433 [Friedmanniomyces endolithicus]|nr:hypothetical protein LTR94_003210 [Friedmanniomyces endolithicus]KAK0805202.1 hypothetical protein LTR59_004143 [Friedmanniomyces endolithicus]KAK0814418.1 hypothetical protein LTR38_002708 [Friedmanniomyces endolithicus]KAK0814677.1 hypothetical protein LTR75_004189 [Friedmanniomyces endolithicus]KAK0856048.1 hypothetical protein LTR03_001456 [Friedmanniomyces endolithicus]
MEPDQITTRTEPNNEQDDPFATLLNLEDTYYTEGYDLGVTDGSRAGRIEGRLFGLEKGFAKFAEMGRLNGRARVWEARLPSAHTPNGMGLREGDIGASTSSPSSQSTTGTISPLSGSDRLRKHIDRLSELTDSESLETKNTEDAVDECEERLAGARSKFTLIAKIVGEDDMRPSGGGEGASEIEIRRSGGTPKGKAGGKGEMEDFAGLPTAGREPRGDAAVNLAAKIPAKRYTH